MAELGPDRQVRPQLIQEWAAAGTMPEVIQYAALIQETTWSTPMTEQNLMHTWDAEKIKKYLPAYTARPAKYGVSVEDLLSFNKFKDQNYYIPIGLGYSQFPALSGMEEAKTEAELQQVFAKNGKLTPQDIVGDIPMKNLDDLYQYLKKVKALGTKVGGKPTSPRS